jgi:alkanesulfonate monooxygenase SsuD/methylene tetrahydromethanopterin reductase-like flavin-dependent oxidoreductase (luciferase family)
MRFWQSLHFCPPEQLIDLAKGAEKAGFRGVTIGDHLVQPWVEEGSPYPYTADGKPPWPLDAAFPDPWITAAAIGQVTSSLWVHTSIFILPLRELLSVAKGIATAAFFTDNRLLPGLGIGWMQAEFGAVRQGFSDRGRRTNEMLELLPRLLRGEPVSASSEFHTFESLQLTRPLPTAPVPLLIGGESPAALRRVAGQSGWVSGPLTLDGLAGAVGAVRAALDEAGRQMDDDFRVMVTLRGKPSSELYERARAEGVTDVQVSFASGLGGTQAPLESKLEQMERFGEVFIRAQQGPS